ncbi:aminotransferase class I/II-fold pyridoxal phosphate-dependent enzyme [Ignavibacteria bacterium]|nr:aminotransferase class I/II-fold pyridoxal phosphate-dependent enzyme [Bacteroidota bacterium]
MPQKTDMYQNDSELLDELDRLDRISRQLEISDSERLETIKATADFADKFIGGLNSAKAFNKKKAENLNLNGDKSSLRDTLELYRKEVAENGINAASGKHLGYIPGGGIFISAIADFIAAVTNPFAGEYFASPGAATIENEVANWLKTIFSFPEESVGILASGGSISTLIAFTAARDKHRVKNEKIRKSVVYLSEQTHHSTHKALRIIGLEDVIIRTVPLDKQRRMNVAALALQTESDIANGLTPFLIVATAGATDTGAVDPLDAIADIAEKHKIWLHIDAAYGGFFILTSKRELFNGIERADSVVTDPHKGMFIPYGVRGVLIKDKSAVLYSHHYNANYMQDAANEELVRSSSNLSPELTKHFRGMRVWLPLKIHGLEPFVACLEEKLLLVRYFRNKLRRLGFQLGPEPDLSISYFRYPFKSQPDERNKRLMEAIHEDGDVFLSSSVINGEYVIRIAILSFRTKKETIDAAAAMISRCLKKEIECDLAARTV